MTVNERDGSKKIKIIREGKTDAKAKISISIHSQRTTATKGVDFNLSSNYSELVFDVNETEKYLNINLIQDDAIEDTEIISLQINTFPSTADFADVSLKNQGKIDISVVDDEVIISPVLIGSNDGSGKLTATNLIEGMHLAVFAPNGYPAYTKYNIQIKEICFENVTVTGILMSSEIK